MANIDMKTLTIGENTYIIIDAGARALIGDLSNLDTTAKNNLVAAINELFQGGGGSSVEPYTSNPADLGSSASPGSSNKFSRGDHVHKKPTPAEIGAGTYSKPSGGIPASDMDSAVQTSLGKADSALQSVPNTYRTAAAQDTIDAGKADKVTVVRVTDSGAVTQALDAGKIYNFAGALTSLTITLNAAEVPAHYHFAFDSLTTAVSLTLPQTVTMPSGFQVEANKHYEIDILDGYGAAQSW